MTHSYHGVDRGPSFLPITANLGHDRWAGGLSGRLDLSFTALPDHYVSPGTGRLSVVRGSDGDVLVQQAARRSGKPVLPGSGIKGAVRTLYEILTGSCGAVTDRCNPQEPCAACRLFGRIGGRRNSRQGRLGFDDAVPVTEDAVTVGIERVPVAHEPHGEHTPGDVRLYDLGPAWGKDPETGVVGPRPCLISREVYRGTFSGRAVLQNVHPQELGLVILALGSAPEEADRFPLRLGGARFHGQGAMRVEIEGMYLLRSPLSREELPAGRARAEAATWVRDALSILPTGGRTALRNLVTVLTQERR